MVRTFNLITDILLPFLSNKDLIEGLAISDVPELRDNFYRIKWVVKFADEQVEIGGSERFRHLYIRGQWEQLLGNVPVAKLPSIGVPGGYLGVQAFYIILENFWRNLVKHDVRQVKERLGRDGGSVSINMRIEDKPGTPFWKVTLWADIETDHKVSSYINEILDAGIIDSEGRFIPEGWGTKEMLTAAAYLRGAQFMHVQPPRNKEILRCDMCDSKHLRYSFDVLKPMELFLLTDKQIDTNLRKSLATKGIYIADKVTQDFIFPTEYMVWDSQTVPSEPSAALRPVKFFKRSDIEVPPLQSDSGLLSLLTQLESEFAKRLWGEEISQAYLVINSTDEQDTKLDSLRFECGELAKEAEEQLSQREIEEIKSKAQEGFVVIFDRHGSLNKNSGMQNLQVWDRLFWEPYGAATQTAFTLQHVPQDDGKKKLLAWRILTSALLKVAILDERVQQILDKPKLDWRYGEGPPIPPLDCLRMMRIWVPHRRNCAHNANAERLDLENPDKEEIKKWIEQKRPHILSIHAGVLDKMGMKQPNDVIKWVNEIVGVLDKTVQRVIIHSGRGIPVNVPHLEVPFIGYSPIEHYLVSKDLKSKYALVQELLSARGIKR
ncbi:MAG: hypothetical protein ONB30_03540 [candidate division KSB1 bacterium]|nr:hypothetical protein [candidate division KSB1 bacterium]